MDTFLSHVQSPSGAARPRRSPTSTKAASRSEVIRPDQGYMGRYGDGCRIYGHDIRPAGSFYGAHSRRKHGVLWEEFIKSLKPGRGPGFLLSGGFPCFVIGGHLDVVPGIGDGPACWIPSGRLAGRNVKTLLGQFLSGIMLGSLHRLGLDGTEVAVLFASLRSAHIPIIKHKTHLLTGGSATHQPKPVRGCRQGLDQLPLADQSCHHFGCDPPG